MRAPSSSSQCSFSVAYWLDGFRGRRNALAAKIKASPSARTASGTNIHVPCASTLVTITASVIAARSPSRTPAPIRKRLTNLRSGAMGSSRSGSSSFLRRFWYCRSATRQNASALIKAARQPPRSAARRAASKPRRMSRVAMKTGTAMKNPWRAPRANRKRARPRDRISFQLTGSGIKNVASRSPPASSQSTKIRHASAPRLTPMAASTMRAEPPSDALAQRYLARNRRPRSSSITCPLTERRHRNSEPAPTPSTATSSPPHLQTHCRTPIVISRRGQRTAFQLCVRQGIEQTPAQFECNYDPRPDEQTERGWVEELSNEFQKQLSGGLN